MMWTRGFSILEAIMYVFAWSLLSVCIFSWIATISKVVSEQYKRCDKLMDLYGALDVLAHDLQGSPFEESFWIKKTESEIVWNTYANESVGWVWNKSSNSLYRIVGTYADGVWKRKYKSLVARTTGPVSMNMHIDKKKGVQKVTCRIGDFSRVVSIENRIVYEKA